MAELPRKEPPKTPPKKAWLSRLGKTPSSAFMEKQPSKEKVSVEEQPLLKTSALALPKPVDEERRSKDHGKGKAKAMEDHIRGTRKESAMALSAAPHDTKLASARARLDHIISENIANEAKFPDCQHPAAFDSFRERINLFETMKNRPESKPKPGVEPQRSSRRAKEPSEIDQFRAAIAQLLKEKPSLKQEGDALESETEQAGMTASNMYLKTFDDEQQREVWEDLAERYVGYIVRRDKAALEIMSRSKQYAEKPE